TIKKFRLRRMNMTNQNKLDTVIINKLLELGLIKKEAKHLLKENVYKFEKSEIIEIKVYSKHFGLSGKKKIIAKILDRRRFAFLSVLIAESINESCDAKLI
ncbi:hypothetical protein VII00023_01955, partial [Vibrio ichthyoenteri ATCC 700023]